ncbi:hypothetical protein [Psychrobacter alimentarius]|uniref:hypothetical protein n=1 Tax=Psychrobacter alimentarius TaxID=261164 RepID=UPI0019193967|nr:hypothetical protein [Psychrobacter alimentarius]
MDVLPTQDTASITLLPRPYSDVVDVETDNPNMLYVAKDVRGITPYALTFNDIGKSMLNEGGAGTSSDVIIRWCIVSTNDI